MPHNFSLEITSPKEKFEDYDMTKINYDYEAYKIEEEHE